MHDDAATHYIDMIDQTTLGHRFIKEEFGVVPRIGRQIVPFGHSAGQAFLLGAEITQTRLNEKMRKVLNLSGRVPRALVHLLSMATIPAEILDEFDPGPMEGLVLRFLKEHQSCAVWEVWQPYEAELAQLLALCVAGRDVWTTKVPLVCFWLVEKHTPDHVVLQFGMIASHKQMLTCYAVGSPEYKQIIDVLSHSHGQRATPHQAVSKPNPPPPLHAFPALEFPLPPHTSLALKFPLPPHASLSPKIPPRIAHAVPNLEIPLPTSHASSHLEIPSPTPCTFFDPARLSLTPPSFDFGFNFNETPPVMNTHSLSYNIGHIDYVPPHSHCMSFMPTPGLHTDPMTIGLTHISSATPSSPAVVGSSVVGS
nr:putative alpha-mannosidase [Quercus suber]